jgi:hypothetical protein
MIMDPDQFLLNEIFRLILVPLCTGFTYALRCDIVPGVSMNTFAFAKVTLLFHEVLFKATSCCGAEVTLLSICLGYTLQDKGKVSNPKFSVFRRTGGQAIKLTCVSAVLFSFLGFGLLITGCCVLMKGKFKSVK